MAQKTERDLDAALIDAAMMLFAERGYAAVRLQDIADRAEMDLGILRQRVANKLDILKLFLRRLDGDVLGEDAGFGPERLISSWSSPIISASWSYTILTTCCPGVSEIITS